MAPKGETGPFTVRLSNQALEDVEQVLLWTQSAFGDAGRSRYEKLIEAALIDLCRDPGCAGVQRRDDIGKGIRTYYLASSRKHVAGQTEVAKPRHLLVFRLNAKALEVARLLHDRMDFPRHVAG